MNYDLKRVSLLHFIWKGEVEKSETEHERKEVLKFKNIQFRGLNLRTILVMAIS